jgi:peroxiredoxin
MLKKIIAIVSGCLLVCLASAENLSGPAPDFDLMSMDGSRVQLSDLEGQVVMVNFWATWCAPCREEMPHLEALYQRYSDLGFTLLGVNVEEDSSGADEFFSETPVSFPILFDPENNVSELYDVVAMPSTVMIDRTGQMRFIHHGYQPGYENEYQSQIRALIRE